jgi:bifunctional non-homologous end joining protein LigD
VQLGPYRFEIGNLDKVLFPESGVTKGELVEHYRAVGEVMVPHLRERPLTLHRFPDGIEAGGFWTKQASRHFPEWIHRVTVPKEKGSVTHVVCDNTATLVYLAGQAAIAMHVWLARGDRLRNPDRMVIDLDPSGASFDVVRRAAAGARDLLIELGLKPFLMATGSSGLHVTVPLDRSADTSAVRAFAEHAAVVLARREPDRYTTEFSKSERRGRLYLDVARNGYAQTVVAPYSVRARPGAPVAVPLEWDELENPDLRPDRWTIRTIGERLAERGDPWAGIGRYGRSLAGPAKRLEELLATESV